MSKINDMLIQAEEDQNNEERLERWRREWKRILELQEQWNGVYLGIEKYKYQWEQPKDED